MPVFVGGLPAGIDCSALLLWATGPADSWLDAEAAKITTLQQQATQWASVDFVAWAGNVPDQAASAADHEFAFAGVGTGATVHLHDDVWADHENVIFAITGGPAGAKWVCKHECSVPDNAFFVSIDPLDLSPNDHLENSPALPPIRGTIDVTYT